MFHWIQSVHIAIVVLIAMSFVVNDSSNRLADILHVLGKKLNIPTSIRAATFDAASSSFPEFMTAIIAVLIYDNFNDVGLPTVAGSAIFNILIIPMASIFAFKGKSIALSIDKRSAARDMGFYILSVSALAMFSYMGYYGMSSGVVLVGVYAAYIIVLYTQAQKHRLENSHESKYSIAYGSSQDMSYSKIAISAGVSIFTIWISIDALIQSAIVISTSLNIPAFIISVVILAACTSIPDMLLSMRSASLGDADAAISNAIGSNIFDICVCLGIPMIISGQNMPVNFSQDIGTVVIGFIFASIVLTGFFVTRGNSINKKHAFAMLGLYLLFVGYISANTILSI